MSLKKKRILVGLSGGVDSAVSAYLLQKQGFDVACGFMINYLEEDNPDCTTRADLIEAKKVADYLGLPFFTFDYREEYERRIIAYIYHEYAIGRTPNPDVFCNNLIKFDLFLEEALALGYDRIATGHYARIFFNDKNHTAELMKGIDPDKDQSYFLSRLSEFQLSKSLFPIGDLSKKQVRAIAKKIGLPNADRKDSQGLCFIGKIPMKEFLERKIEKKPGNILSTDGRILGTHEGAFAYTIGQRKGIKLGGGPALFVIAKDTQKNTITVGNAADLALFSSSCLITDWVGDFPISEKIYHAKIRYRQADQLVHIEPEGEYFRLRFDVPQRAIASGQIAVVYDGDRVVGSGVIM